MKSIRIHYLDASAIVKLVVQEIGSAELRQYVGKESNFIATSLCFAEALGVLKAKRFFREEITDEEYFSGCEELMAYVADSNIEIINFDVNDKGVFREIEKLTKNYNEGKSIKKTIDIADAFQIVSVKMDYFSQFPNTDSKPILITGDKALANAAREQDIRVWYCIDDSPPDEI